MSHKIGILCAGDDELAPFLPHLQDCVRSSNAMLTVYEGSINNQPVALLYSGVCKVNAAIATQVLIDGYHADAVINAGVAGGMDSRVGLLDIVVSTQSAYHDVADEILTEFHPWMPSVWFDNDPRLLAAARLAADAQQAHPVHFGRMVSGEQFIADDGRDAINSSHAPLSVDMETAAVAHVCHVNGIPFLAVRAISDTADHAGNANFEKNCLQASVIAKDFVLALLGTLDSAKGLHLRKLSPDDGMDIYNLLQQIDADDHGFGNKAYGMSYDEYREWLQGEYAVDCGKLEDWMVPQTSYWLYDGDTPVGYGRIRHCINDHLRQFSGHIGYAIGKPHRGKGYGKAILALLMEESKRLDISELQVAANTDNERSNKVIIANGGKLLRTFNGKNFYSITL